MDNIKASLDTREHQIEHIRDFINQKVDLHHTTNPGVNPMVLLCGDLNVNSCEHDVALNNLRKQLEEEGKQITPY